MLNFHLSETLSTIQTLVKSTGSYKKDCDCVVLYCNAFEIEPYEERKRFWFHSWYSYSTCLKTVNDFKTSNENNAANSQKTFFSNLMIQISFTI